MRKTFLTSVAAFALLAGGGLAAAQGMKPDSQSTSPSASEPKAQSPAAAPEMKRDPSRAQAKPDAKMDKMDRTTQSDTKPSDMKRGDTKSPANARTDSDKTRDSAQSKDMDKNKNPSAAQNKDMDSPNRTNAQSDTDKSRSSTTVNNNTNKTSNTNVTLSTEQRTKIRTTVLKERNAPRVSRVNFNVSVGTRVPTSVHVVTVPQSVVQIYPQWSGYLYFIVNDRIVIIEPDTHEIVAVIAA